MLAGALAVLGALATVLAVTGGAPFGAVERVAVYAPIVWQIVVGSVLLVRDRPDGTMTA